MGFCSPKRELRFSPVRMAGIPHHAPSTLPAEDALVLSLAYSEKSGKAVFSRRHRDTEG